MHLDFWILYDALASSVASDDAARHLHLSYLRTTAHGRAHALIVTWRDRGLALWARAASTRASPSFARTRRRQSQLNGGRCVCPRITRCGAVLSVCARVVARVSLVGVATQRLLTRLRCLIVHACGRIDTALSLAVGTLDGDAGDSRRPVPRGHLSRVTRDDHPGVRIARGFAHRLRHRLASAVTQHRTDEREPRHERCQIRPRGRAAGEGAAVRGHRGDGRPLGSRPFGHARRSRRCSLYPRSFDLDGSPHARR